MNIGAKSFDLPTGPVDLELGRGINSSPERILAQLSAAKTEIVSTFNNHWSDLFLKDGLEKAFGVFDLSVLGTDRTKSKPWFLAGIRTVAERFGRHQTVSLRRGTEPVEVAPILKLCGNGFTRLMEEAGDVYSILAAIGEERVSEDSQGDLYAGFLRRYGSEYESMGELVRLMIVFAVGSSYVERMNSNITALLTPQRN
eukprot:858886_1